MTTASHPHIIEQPPPSTLIEAWQKRLTTYPQLPILHYFDQPMLAEELEQLSNSFAVELQQRGITPGHRIGIHLQNIPAYIIALLAIWKAGATAVIINPMYLREDLKHILTDSGASGIICTLGDQDLVRTQCPNPSTWIITANPRNFQTRNDTRAFTPLPKPPENPAGNDFLKLAQAHPHKKPTPNLLNPQDSALITYTSGTTGPPKGAMNSHHNMLSVGNDYAKLIHAQPEEVALAIAPFFHITGVMAGVIFPIVYPGTIVLAGRFNPDIAIDLLTEYPITHIVGSITVYHALSAHPKINRNSFTNIRSLYSGGAPVPAASVELFEKRFGHYIHNAYGMTETSAAVIGVEFGQRAPIDPTYGALSIGKPLGEIEIRIIDPTGQNLPPNTAGELLIRGPQVVSGYWQQPQATASTFNNGWLHTGDVAVIDQHGWIYLVDRIKDQINSSGYKVWPREVEDALYHHPTILEAAVVGMPDDYRGEAVTAYVSIKPNAQTTAQELISHCRLLLAPYKVPRSIHFVDALPKTATGKIRRIELKKTASANTKSNL